MHLGIFKQQGYFWNITKCYKRAIYFRWFSFAHFTFLTQCSLEESAFGPKKVSECVSKEAIISISNSLFYICFVTLGLVLCHPRLRFSTLSFVNKEQAESVLYCHSFPFPVCFVSFATSWESVLAGLFHTSGDNLFRATTDLSLQWFPLVWVLLLLLFWRMGLMIQHVHQHKPADCPSTEVYTLASVIPVWAERSTPTAQTPWSIF